MSKQIRVALDAMGGDHAPEETVKGAVLAVAENQNVIVYLFGKEDALQAELDKYKDADRSRLIVKACSEVVAMAEKPIVAIRAKKDSSLVKALEFVRDGEADAFVSAGSTGAVLVGGQTIIGKIPGIKRAPLAPLIPTKRGVSLLIDCGANVDPKPEYLLSFAQMGTVYMERVLGKKHPKVAIVNIGAEEEKGNALVKETMPLLKAEKGLNFVGSIEARDIPEGKVDVILTDAFTGNVILKLYEGLATSLIGIVKKGLLSTIRSKIGAALALPALKKSLSDFDAAKYGGAPLLGLKGLVVKTHGSSKSVEVKNSILQCETFGREDVNGAIREKLGK